MDGQQERDSIFDAFRRWGYLQADLDPLGYLQPQPISELDRPGEIVALARRYYCGSIGVEFMHLHEPDRRRWIAVRMETEPAVTDHQSILEMLARAAVFEQLLHTRHPGTKRFSLEGVTALLPLLDAALSAAAEREAEEVMLAMSHRGRLNVMVHIVDRSPADVFVRFEDVDPDSVLGSGDVKYHVGATGEFRTANGRKLTVHLVSNPSHLEAVDPVALGRVRAKQIRVEGDGTKTVLPITLHGDAAFAGQGIAAETLNMAGLKGFSVGGTVHVILNNLIGFTTNPEELHSSRFASDLAKRLPIPVFHVNAEDPDAVVRVARLAVQYRYTFQTDAMIDLIGYRRYGHSEVDDPTITQPIQYRKIHDLQPLWQSYARKKSLEAAGLVERLRREYEAAENAARTIRKMPPLRQFPAYWSSYKGGPYNPAYEKDTALPVEELQEIARLLTRDIDGFAIHPKVKRLLDRRAQMGLGQRPMDFAMAEALAFGSLLRQGIPVRLTRQDSRRGTFSQRYAVLIDVETEAEYVPHDHLSANQARFEIYNSALSEAAVLGFEYGYSRDYPETLVLWEAQFGDFANGAQIIIDQFVAAGESKWGLLSGLVLLLPHGYEGQGPEHSSARIERFLQLAACENLQICQPSTATQYFHLLRRQALWQWRKPLIIFTPKGMLRREEASSSLADFSRQRFLRVLPDHEIAQPERMLVATGKVVHELRLERTKRKDAATAIVSLEQLYPFPESELAAALDAHPALREIVWVQEEPANMGAWPYVLPRLRRLAKGRSVRSVRRSASASPATGSAKAHELEQRTLLALAFVRGAK